MNTKVITGVALVSATVLASPAFAQSARVHHRDAYQAYAQVGPYGPHWGYSNRLRHPAHPSWDVYNTNGKYVGSDPDPNVRDMIARDHRQQLNGGY